MRQLARNPGALSIPGLPRRHKYENVLSSRQTLEKISTKLLTRLHFRCRILTALVSCHGEGLLRGSMLTGFVTRLQLTALLAIICSGALNSQSENFEVRFQHATDAMRSGQLDEAAADFSKCIAAKPDFAESYFNLGLIRLQQARPGDAAALFIKSLKLKPGLHGADLFLGISEYRVDKYPEAVAALKRAADLEPSNPEVLMWLGVAQLAAGDTSFAVSSLEKASKLNPKDLDILYHLGQAYMDLSKQSYERMYQADPKSWRVHEVLAESFEQADRLDDAIKECQDALKIRPHEPGLHQLLGEIYWKQNNLGYAEAEFQAELNIEPQNYTAMYKLATVSIERSKPEIAVALLNQILREHPESRAAYYELGRAEAQLGKTEDAIRDFSITVNGAASVDPEILRQSYYQLAQLYRRAQRPEESRIALNEFVRLKQQADSEQDQKLQDKLKRSTEPQP